MNEKEQRDPSRALRASRPIEDTTFDLTFESPNIEQGSSMRASLPEEEAKVDEDVGGIDILKDLEGVGEMAEEESEITHTQGDYGTFLQKENLETKLVESVKRANEYLRKWEAARYKEQKKEGEQEDSIELDRATLLHKNFHLPEKVLRKCRGPDHKLIFELVLVEAATHFHRVMSNECPEVAPMLALMADLQRNKVLPELLSHARQCDQNTLHEMI